MSLLLCPHRTQALATLANALSIGRSNPTPPFQALFLGQPAGPDITRQPPPPHHQAQTHQSARARTPKHLRQTDTCGDSKAKGKAKATRKTSRQSEREDEERRNCSHNQRTHQGTLGLRLGHKRLTRHTRSHATDGNDERRGALEQKGSIAATRHLHLSFSRSRSCCPSLPPRCTHLFQAATAAAHSFKRPDTLSHPFASRVDP